MPRMRLAVSDLHHGLFWCLLSFTACRSDKTREKKCENPDLRDTKREERSDKVKAWLIQSYSAGSSSTTSGLALHVRRQGRSARIGATPITDAHEKYQMRIRISRVSWRRHRIPRTHRTRGDREREVVRFQTPGVA